MESNENGLKIAVVTGASSRLGRCFALKLADMGYAVVLHFNHSKTLVDETKKLIEKQGGVAYQFQADFKVEKQIRELWRYIDTLSGQLEVMVNSAAVIYKKSIMDLEINDLDEVLGINLKAPMVCSQEAVKRMKDGGVIINISDAGVDKFWTAFSGYMISKAALEMMTILMAKKLAPKIRVNAIAPGLVFPTESISNKEWQDLLNKLPMKRAAEIIEITSLLGLIIQNKYLTGQILKIDGGMSFQK